MRKLALTLCACAALFAVAPGVARAGQCGLPDRTTWWIDYGDGNASAWETFAQPGRIVAAAGLIYPPQIRQRGAKTVFWDMYLNKRVGTPTVPKTPEQAVAAANKLFDFAATSSNCATPLIAENELFGASLPSPWSETNARYRANVLLYLQTLAARGARPFLLVNSTPYTDGEAGDWWRAVAQVSDIVREVYFPAPKIYGQGPIVGNRALRNAFRRSILDFTAIGIPVAKLGIMLGFQTERGAGGREGLERNAWLEVIKWQALAVQQASTELKFASVWSWGWANWGQRGLDPDKPAAACVYLWARSRALCDGPAAAGARFNASLVEGQLRVPGGLQCTSRSGSITLAGIRQLQTLTGDREIAYTALLARLAESTRARVTTAQVLAGERGVIASRFAGSVGAYRAALREAHASVAVARGVIADQLRRGRIEATLNAPAPSSAAVTSFYLAYPELLTRQVEAKPAPWWLGWRTRGLAISSLAPASLFTMPGGRKGLIRTMIGSYAVRPLGETVELGALPLERARPAISSALRSFARGAAFEGWSANRQSGVLPTVTCRSDDLPAPGAIDLSMYLPFLAPTG
ncbi:MAG: hypothetical protein M3540_07355 [Actinomycetota bacterium]|nr:hypothetical protein [Actinomycetota bacterium]